MKTCPTCNNERMIYIGIGESPRPCPTCRVDEAAAHHESNQFRPETITDDEAALVRRMTPEERAYLCGRLVEREGPDTPEARATLFAQMAELVFDREFGKRLHRGALAHLRRRWAQDDFRITEYARLFPRLLDEIEDLHQTVDVLRETERVYKEACAALPDDPPEGHTLPEAIRTMRAQLSRIHAHVSDLISEEPMLVEELNTIRQLAAGTKDPV